jgi:hypothetical protein
MGFGLMKTLDKILITAIVFLSMAVVYHILIILSM